MNPISLAKLALAAAGIIVFLLGVKTGNAMVRWTGTALVVVAWLMRFVDRPAARGTRGSATAAHTDTPEE